MIAVISSTIFPSSVPSHDGVRTTLTPENRLHDTQATIGSLLDLGISQIFLADNSPGTWVESRSHVLAPATVVSFHHPPVRNKGIGEMWLLLGIAGTLPADEPILKISGRYKIGPETSLQLRDGDDVVGKVYEHGRLKTLSTRCYLIRNRPTAIRLWQRTLDEIYAEQARITGPRSLIRIAANSMFPKRDRTTYSDPTASVEASIYRAMQYLSLRLRSVEKLDVDGILGSWINPRVKE